MINLNPYSSESTLEVFSQILQSKDPETQVILFQIEAEIRAQFELFDVAHRENQLESINALETSLENKVELKNLYSSRSKKILQLKNYLLTCEENNKNSTCQYCTLNIASTLDHVLPKADFPEFSVNALNLLPCCYECNNIKNSTWLIGDQRQFLNFYTDILPHEQYLFIDVNLIDNVPELNFSLRNEGAIAQTEFDLIVRHYDNLHLFERFSKASNTIVVNLANSLKSLPVSMSDSEVSNFIRENAQRNKEYFGYNYWKSVIEISLANSDEFIQFYRR